MSSLFNKSSGRSNEFYLDSQLLINGVKKRPLLYDSTLKDFKRSKTQKREAWLEICEEIMPNWHNFTEEEQEFCENELQKKWRNMRDCYTKEYKRRINQSSTKKGQRPYVYYEAMSFLLPMAQRRHPCDTDVFANVSIDQEDSSTSAVEVTEKHADDTADDDTMEYNETFPQEDLKHFIDTGTTSESRRSINRIKITSATNSSVKKPQSKSKFKVKHSMNKMLKHLEEQIYSKTDERDPDEMFLLSLLPLWKKMTDDTRLSTQIDVLRLVQTRLSEQN